MQDEKNTNRPANVPAENIYMRLHWSIYIALLAAITAIYFVVNASG